MLASFVRCCWKFSKACSTSEGHFLRKACLAATTARRSAGKYWDEAPSIFAIMANASVIIVGPTSSAKAVGRSRRSLWTTVQHMCSITCFWALSPSSSSLSLRSRRILVLTRVAMLLISPMRSFAARSGEKPFCASFWIRWLSFWRYITDHFGRPLKNLPQSWIRGDNSIQLWSFRTSIMPCFSIKSWKWPSFSIITKFENVVALGTVM